MKIPSNKIWSQFNLGNAEGVLHETHNTNLVTQGEVGLSKKSIALITDSGDYDKTMALVYFNGNYIAITDDWAFEGDLSGNTFEAITGGSGMSASTDAVPFNGYLYVTKDTSLSRWSGSAWNNSLDTYTTGLPHPICVFDSMTTYKLAVGNGYQVETLDTSHNANSTVLSLPQNYIITCLVYRNGYLYIGTKEINGGEAAIFLWNGDGANAQYRIDVGASWVYAMTPYRGTVACVTNEGELLTVNGTSVQQLAVFPVFHKQGVRWDEGNALRGKVYNRGMIAQGDTILVNIEGKCDSGFVPEMKSGVWCFDPRNGLYHLTTPTTNPWTSDNAITHSSGVFTSSATNNILLGDGVLFTAVAGVVGITTNVLYYAIPVTTTTFKIASTLQDAFSGNNINTTGTVTTDTLHYAPNTDNGNTYNASSGAILLTNYLDNGKFVLFSGDFIYGSSTKNPSGTAKNVLCVQSPQRNTGGFSFQRIYTENITEVWKSVYLFIIGLLGSAEKAIVKYSTKNLPSRLVSGTWVNATQFNTTDFTPRNQYVVGDEVEIVDGIGQGRTAHITALSTSDTVCSITVDESYGSAGTALVCYFTKNKKSLEITSVRENEYFAKAPFDVKNNWVEVSVELRGYEPVIPAIELTNSGDKRAV